MQMTRGTAFVCALAALSAFRGGLRRAPPFTTFVCALAATSAFGLIAVAYLVGMRGTAEKPQLAAEPQVQTVDTAGLLPPPPAQQAEVEEDAADELPRSAAQQAQTTGTAGNDRLAEAIAPNWPTVLTPVAPADPSEQPPAQWSAKDVEEGRARCAALLKDLDVVAQPADPIREGEACGTPAPMHLISIGSSPRIAFSPPPTLNCDMIVALHTWLQRDVQPLARKHLGTPVVGVKTMSSFSCRNAYGRTKTKLSEHGRVNAIDVGGFVTDKGDAQVVADWGLIARESATRVTEAEAEAVKRQAEAAAAARKGKAQGGPQQGTRLAAPAPDTGRSHQAGTAIELPRVTFGFRTSGDGDLSTGLGWAPPSRLGGPKAADTTATPGAMPGGKAAFLHAIHEAACAIFSTVLGPEADKAHRNHFHLDLAARKSANICQ
jgi:hypothetical protein